MNIKHLSKNELESGIGSVRESPMNNGELKMIVRRPEEGEREVLDQGELDLELGLVGDNWKSRGSSRTDDGFGHPDMQITIMNARAIELIAVEKERWPLAGDQLYIDINLSHENLPPGSRLKIGTAVVEITPIPHTGCRAFTDRFGVDAVKFVNTGEGKELNLRGINTRVVVPGIVKVGDIAAKC
jgi:MOSC domain-containing protein YiiM